jgi:UDP-N-acetylmuramoyl-tripeptide--D-alanyl-D-alanine ligase
MEGKILQGSPSLSFDRFNIDSRQSKPGELFFAITAERDGHNYVSHSVQKGAAGAVISHKIPLPNQKTALIQVKDTVQALQLLAKRILQKSNSKVIGITGSVGKTTTKEFTAALISNNRYILKSEGNYNNYLGLPLSLLRLTKEDELAVLEYGMSSPGEITALTRIAPPGKRKGKQLFFGTSEGHDISAENIRKDGWKGTTFDLNYGQEKTKIFIPFFCKSSLYNFLAAAGVAYALSIPAQKIADQAKHLTAFPNRGGLVHLENNIKLIDDSYNSNPAALEMALKDLAELPGSRKVAILGDMLELGKNETEFHIQAGKKAAQLGLDLLVTIGPLSLNMAKGALASGMKHSRIFSYQDSGKAAEEIKSFLREGDVILVKGSRGIKTEKIINGLKGKG